MLVKKPCSKICIGTMKIINIYSNVYEFCSKCGKNKISRIVSKYRDAYKKDRQISSDVFNKNVSNPKDVMIEVADIQDIFPIENKKSVIKNKKSANKINTVKYFIFTHPATPVTTKFQDGAIYIRANSFNQKSITHGSMMRKIAYFNDKVTRVEWSGMRENYFLTTNVFIVESIVFHYPWII